MYQREGEIYSGEAEHTPSGLPSFIRKSKLKFKLLVENDRRKPRTSREEYMLEGSTPGGRDGGQRWAAGSWEQVCRGH